jgi:hypothetical protein
LNKRNLLERELSTQYSERKWFVPNQSLETWFVKGLFKAAYHCCQALG